MPQQASPRAANSTPAKRIAEYASASHGENSTRHCAASQTYTKETPAS